MYLMMIYDDPLTYGVCDGIKVLLKMNCKRLMAFEEVVYKQIYNLL